MEIMANAVQTVAANQNILFNEVAIPSSPTIVHRPGSGIVKLRGITRGQWRARFKVTFNSNLGIPSGGNVTAVSLAVSADGEPISATQMIVTPAAVSEYFNVASTVYIDVPVGCCTVLSVENTSTQSVSVQNANLIVERVA